MADLSPLRRRMIEDMEHVAGDATILHQRGFEVQPVFWPVARAIGSGGRSRLP
jgi:hypothetical protein